MGKRLLHVWSCNRGREMCNPRMRRCPAISCYGAPKQRCNAGMINVACTQAASRSLEVQYRRSSYQFRASCARHLSSTKCAFRAICIMPEPLNCTPETVRHNTNTLINADVGVVRQGGVMSLLLLCSLHLGRLGAFTHGLLLLLLALQIAGPESQIVAQQLHDQRGILVRVLGHL